MYAHTHGPSAPQAAESAARSHRLAHGHGVRRGPRRRRPLLHSRSSPVSGSRELGTETSTCSVTGYATLFAKSEAPAPSQATAAAGPSVPATRTGRHDNKAQPMPSPPARQGRIQEQDGPAMRNYYGEAGSAGMRFSERWTQLRTRQSASSTLYAPCW